MFVFLHYFSLYFVTCNFNCVQVQLPVRWGELGLRNATQLATSAFLSLAAAENLMRAMLPTALLATLDPFLDSVLISWRAAWRNDTTGAGGRDGGSTEDLGRPSVLQPVRWPHCSRLRTSHSRPAAGSKDRGLASGSPSQLARALTGRRRSPHCGWSAPESSPSGPDPHLLLQLTDRCRRT